MKKTFVVIPGTLWQIPIVERIKEKGHKVLCVHPDDDSPLFPLVDGYLKEDMFCTEAVIEYCLAEGADAILSEECDIAMPAVAKYGRILGLPALSEEAAHLFTDKYAMREFCSLHGLPCPEYQKCYTKDEAIAFFRTLRKKTILKPLDSNSSRGVFTVENEQDIEIHFDEALSYSRIQKAVLMERYIEGVEFTLDGVKTPERHVSLAISEKKHFPHNKNIASELYFTHSNPNYDYDLLRNINDSFVNASPLQFGLTHAEYKFEDGVFYLIEIAARGGGNLISSHIVPFLSAVDNYDYLIDCCLGNITTPDFSVSEDNKNRAAVLKFFETPGEGGTVAEIKGIEFLRENPAILSYSFNFRIGDRILPAKNDAARVGYYIAGCEDADTLNKLMEDIQKNIKIVLK